MDTEPERNAAARGDAAVLGVVVPCRDEAAVIGRKLANLARLEWPTARRDHRVLVVDDGSTDGTADRAAACATQLEPCGVKLEVVPNDDRPGKAGALRAGLRALAGHADLFVLTDADVVLEPTALAVLERAFASDPSLGLACGAQLFVRDLADDGSPLGSDGALPRPAAGLYDRLTAWIRRIESRVGRLFSVHGQLLAWRAGLDIEPTPGYAADDLDLMLQARQAGANLRLVAGARFLEVKTPAGPAREAQALRRARAYVQLLGHPRMAQVARLGGPLERAQVWAYRRLPTGAPWLVPLGLALVVLVGTWTLPPAWALTVWLVLAVLAVAGIGRRLFALLAVIRTAARSESAAGLSDRWETPRA